MARDVEQLEVAEVAVTGDPVTGVVRVAAGDIEGEAAVVGLGEVVLAQLVDVEHLTGIVAEHAVGHIPIGRDHRERIEAGKLVLAVLVGEIGQQIAIGRILVVVDHDRPVLQPVVLPVPHLVAVDVLELVPRQVHVDEISEV